MPIPRGSWKHRCFRATGVKQVWSSCPEQIISDSFKGAVAKGFCTTQVLQEMETWPKHLKRNGLPTDIQLQESLPPYLQRFGVSVRSKPQYIALGF